MKISSYLNFVFIDISCKLFSIFFFFFLYDFILLIELFRIFCLSILLYVVEFLLLKNKVEFFGFILLELFLKELIFLFE